MIFEYNRYMGAVDLHDNGVANYRIGVRGKKWWWPLFENAMRNAVVNAWKINNRVNEKAIPQIDFLSNVVRDLTKFDSCEARPNSELGPQSASSQQTHTRYDNVGHYIIRNPMDMRTLYQCEKCDVHLPPECFRGYHVR